MLILSAKHVLFSGNSYQKITSKITSMGFCFGWVGEWGLLMAIDEFSVIGKYFSPHVGQLQPSHVIGKYFSPHNKT